MRGHRAALLQAWLLCAVCAQCLGTGGGGTASAQHSGLEAALPVQARPWDVAGSVLVWVRNARPLGSLVAQHALAAQAVPRRLLQPGRGSAAAGSSLWPEQLLHGLTSARYERSAPGARRLLQGSPAAAPGAAASPPAYLLVVMEVRLLSPTWCMHPEQGGT